MLVIIGLLTALFTLSGCTFFDQTEQDEPNLLDILPTNWYPIFPGNEWRAISVDDDTENEYLLLYAYNTLQTTTGNFVNSQQVPTGGSPIGAIIVDGQTSSEYVVDFPPLATPLQPIGSFIAYRIAPSYWPEPNTAYVGLYTNPNQIAVFPYQTGQSGICGSIGDEDPLGEFAIVDTLGPRALTTVWWRGAFLGYGVAQVTAPGGLRNARGMTATGEVAIENIATAGPVWSVDALFPIHEPTNPLSTAVEGGFADPGRSLLCDVYRYYRTIDLSTSGSKVREDIRYTDDYMGIQFCRDDVPDPFFPEAVALKFMLEPEAREDLFGDGVDPPEQIRIIGEVAELDRRVTEPGDYCAELSEEQLPKRSQYRVSDIQTRAALEYTESYRLDRSADQTEVKQLRAFVCAEITAVDPNDPFRELLFFTLGHVPPRNLEENGVTVHYTDQLRVLDINDASGWGFTDCKELIAANTVGGPP